MMKFKAIFLFFILAACDAPSKLPAIKDATGPLSPQNARVTIYRSDSDIFRTPDVTVNGQGKPLAEQDAFVVDVPAGMADMVSESWDGGDARLRLPVEKQKHYYVRFADLSAWFTFEPVPESVAKQEMQLKAD